MNTRSRTLLAGLAAAFVAIVPAVADAQGRSTKTTGTPPAAPGRALWEQPSKVTKPTGAQQNSQNVNNQSQGSQRRGKRSRTR